MIQCSHSAKKANRKLYYMVSNSPFLNFYSHLQGIQHFMPFSGTWGIEWSDAWSTVSAMQLTLSWPREIWQVLGSPENLIFYGTSLCLWCQIVQLGVIFQTWSVWNHKFIKNSMKKNHQMKNIVNMNKEFHRTMNTPLNMLSIKRNRNIHFKCKEHTQLYCKYKCCKYKVFVYIK